MSLDPVREERPRLSYQANLILIACWALWLILVSTWSLPFRFSLNCSAIVILVGAFWWGFWEASAFILLMSWIFYLFSMTTPGFYWVSLLCLFLTFRALSFRFSIENIGNFLLMAFSASLLLDLIQAILMRQFFHFQVFSFLILFRILASAMLQTVIAWVFSRPLMGLLETR